MKPVEFVERAIRNSSRTRDAMLDLFDGSGTTVIVCEKSGRLARLIELKPKYCDVIVARWQAFRGWQVLLDGNGRTFTEVARVRQQAAA
jgi:DNA modification methylase